MEEESGSEALKIALTGKKLAKSWFDFINVNLYSHEDKYEVKQQSYWMWSETQQKLQEYKTSEFMQWYAIEEYIKNNIVYIKI